MCIAICIASRSVLYALHSKILEKFLVRVKIDPYRPAPAVNRRVRAVSTTNSNSPCIFTPEPMLVRAGTDRTSKRASGGKKCKNIGLFSRSDARCIWLRCILILSCAHALEGTKSQNVLFISKTYNTGRQEIWNTQKKIKIQTEIESSSDGVYFLVAAAVAVPVPVATTGLAA